MNILQTMSLTMNPVFTIFNNNPADSRPKGR
jgi:hypothetical protein